MTFKRFAELWDKAGLNNLPKFKNPLVVDEMSPHTIDALVRASDGDFSTFDEIDRRLAAMGC
jgi:hypothetical protein